MMSKFITPKDPDKELFSASVITSDNTEAWIILMATERYINSLDDRDGQAVVELTKFQNWLKKESA